MARFINLPGLVALLVVSRREEIASLIDHPLLDRRYIGAGPMLNRWLLASVLRETRHQGQPLDAFRPRDDSIRKVRQRELVAKLDGIATSQAWPQMPLMDIARYIVEGKGRREAQAALAYALAWPFLADRADGDDSSYKQIGRDLWRLHRRASFLRRPVSVVAPLQRLFGAHRHNRAKIMQLVGASEYGLHAVEIGLANAAEILERMRNAMKGGAAGTPLLARQLTWAAIGTAPALVVRQSGAEPISLPYVAARVPPHTVVLLRMREAMDGGADSGFEFASSSWSACPARRYVMELFKAVADTAVVLARGARRP